jgi:antibiotic biosynthesis monooxygenase (ABM) superfamily enzyme
MEFWFTPNLGKGVGRRIPLAPPPYKMAIVTIAVIFILLTTLISQIHRLTEGLPSLLRILMETSILVVLMTYVIMPNLTRY